MDGLQHAIYINHDELRALFPKGNVLKAYIPNNAIGARPLVRLDDERMSSYPCITNNTDVPLHLCIMIDGSLLDPESCMLRNENYNGKHGMINPGEVVQWKPRGVNSMV